MLNPIIVTAPLKRNQLEETDIDNVYIFDYNNSFENIEDKPCKMIAYLQSLGCMCDLLFDGVSYEDKEKILLEYFNCGTFFNLYSLTSTIISILFEKKGILYSGRTIFDKYEQKRFIINNEVFVNKLIEIFDSLFVVMLMYSVNPTNDMKEIRNKYTVDRIDRSELSPNIMNVLLYRDFYNYYDQHINKDVYYYEFLFEKSLYKSKSFIDILTNSENVLLKLLFDMNNPKFKEYIMKKESL